MDGLSHSSSEPVGVMVQNFPIINADSLCSGLTLLMFLNTSGFELLDCLCLRKPAFRVLSVSWMCISHYHLRHKQSCRWYHRPVEVPVDPLAYHSSSVSWQIIVTDGKTVLQKNESQP